VLQAVRNEASLQARAVAADAEIRRLAQARGPIVVGPWLSEVGFELLYWLPLLRWLAANHSWTPDRVTAITRGGAGAWYEGLAAERVEVFDVLAPEELAAHQAAKREATGSMKQLDVDELDRTLLARAGAQDATLIHPRLMYRLFAPFWAGRRPMTFLARHTRFERLPAPPADDRITELVAGLPRPFVAVKAYFSDCFPDTAANRAWLARVLDGIGERAHVVLLGTPFDADDHRDFDGTGSWTDLSADMRPQDNLAVQTAVIREARALLSTYGGFSYLGALLGVPAFAFYSEQNFVPAHLEAGLRAAEWLAEPGAPGVFTPFSVQQAAALLDLGASPA
jgi:hypothetical protein